MAEVFNCKELDCPVVPSHLAYKISQENWDWINKTTMQLYHGHMFNMPSRYVRDLKPWMIRGYWLITYFCNPSEENLTWLLNAIKQYKMIDNNLMLLEFVADLKPRVKGC